MLLPDQLVIGATYTYEDEKLVYLGRGMYLGRESQWHEFATPDKPNEVYTDFHDDQLDLVEVR